MFSLSTCSPYNCGLYVPVVHTCATFNSTEVNKMTDKYWKISDFAKRLDKHTNTVDGWFRNLENERRLHYILRVNDEKVYDELDLEIAQFIIKQRNNKWSLNAIFDSLSDHFSLRPFPDDFEGETKSVQVVDIDKIRATIMNELKTTFDQVAAEQMKQQMQEFQKMLPSPEDKRLDRFNEMMAERKINRILEEEAISLWSEKPEEERMKKVGLFRKEEDRNKREAFIRDYLDEHFEAYMKQEFDIE